MGRNLTFPAGIPEWLQREVLDYDLPLAQPPDLILDIGAHIGAFTLLARQRWPRAVIHAYEPVPENALAFRSFVPANPKSQLHVVAVRANSGNDALFLGDCSVTGSFHQLGRQTAKTRRVVCVAAATLPRAQFVKIDTEGCEVEILMTLDLTETQVLAVEYHRADDAQEIRTLAKARGLALHDHKPLGPTWGILIFARPGALVVAASRQSAANPPIQSAALSRAAATAKPFLAIPAYGGVNARFLQCLLRAMEETPIPFGLHVNAGDSSVCRSRNTLAGIFLEGEFTDLIFIDSDIVFTTQDLVRLLSHDEDVVGGFYPKKKAGEPDWVFNALPDHLSVGRPDGLMEVSYMGTGFLRIRRHVFERMILARPAMAYSTDHDHYRTEYAFFVDEVRRDFTGRDRYLTEDWNFCARCADLGIKVFGDTAIRLKHVGEAVYPIPEPDFVSRHSQPFSGPHAGTGPRGPEFTRPGSDRAEPISPLTQVSRLESGVLSQDWPPEADRETPDSRLQTA